MNSLSICFHTFCFFFFITWLNSFGKTIASSSHEGFKPSKQSCISTTVVVFAALHKIVCLATQLQACVVVAGQELYLHNWICTTTNNINNNDRSIDMEARAIVCLFVCQWRLLWSSSGSRMAPWRDWISWESRSIRVSWCLKICTLRGWKYIHRGMRVTGLKPFIL